MNRNQRLAKYEQERIEHTPWVEKYRPKNLDEVASQEHTVKILKKTLESANLPHMLFYGPPGTGKTSTILALAKQLYGPRLFKSRVLELNASDERGISIVRQKVKNFARLAVSNASKEDLENYPCPPYKLIILDEADSMTNDAQSALRRTIENYSGVTRFCLICNYITRIIDPLSSRCSKFRFGLLNNENALQRIRYIVEKENLNVDEDVPETLLSISNGDLRKAITFLQSASRLSFALENPDDNEDRMHVDEGNGKITKPAIQEIAGIIPDDVLKRLVTTIEKGNTREIFNTVQEFILGGWSAQQVLDQLHDSYVMNHSLKPELKNKIALILFSSDCKLNSGTDEHIQLLNFCLQVAKAF